MILRVAFILACLGASNSVAQSRPIAPVPIIFVHGNGDDAAKWIGIIWLFESNHYPADKLFAIRFSHPNARTNDTVDEVNRSSTTDATAELSAFVTRVLIETHSAQVALIGSSRGGMTIRNYLLHGGSQNVAYAITCGTPNHGVLAMDANPDAEFNGKGHYLLSLNHAYGPNSEAPPGVRMMTLRSDNLDKYAQPSGIAFGKPEMVTGVSYQGPELAGATNVVLANRDHRELAFDPSAFVQMYTFITGEAPTTTRVTPVSSPTLSGLITGFENGAFTNLPLAGVHLRIYPVNASESTTPVYEVVTKADGKWGPFSASATQEYDFDLEFQGRHVRMYKAPLPRSTGLLNLRFLPVPTEAPGKSQQGRELLIERPEGYFSRDRDPVMIDNKVSSDEPAGFPLEDAFLAHLSAATGEMTTVVLRKKSLLPGLPPIWQLTCRWLICCGEPTKYNPHMQRTTWATIALGSLLLMTACSKGRQAMQSQQAEDSKPAAKAEQRGRILGIGGIFFKSAERDQMRAWYAQHLGLADKGEGVMLPWREHDDPQKEHVTVWTIFPASTRYFEPSPAPFMVNYIVDDMDALLDRLKQEGVKIDAKQMNESYGRFAWIYDPDGNKIELWQPEPAKP